ncbi:MAG TPA: ABC transporter substrate-binding protein [Bacillota bacterium]|nr:ABC transporter substrate-binding protein [Bacillota bacterium]HOL10444.1 ABC transporter substrate-binding protein [Bacillota bacterium]HPO98719.1 ABC transporter substrate-binding protein [Bacillota bacterium]
MRLRSRIVFKFLLVIFLLFTASCHYKQESIKVGFVGTLIGRYSDISINCRNGVMLAVEEINQNGGVNGIPIELIIKDDQMDPETAIRVNHELHQSGVQVVIGHMTSAMSSVALPEITKLKMLMISPTTSATSFSGLDDYFLRVYPSNEQSQQILAQFIYYKYKLKKIAIVADLRNQNYSEEWAVDFRTEFQRLGGEIEKMVSFYSRVSVNMNQIAQQILEAKPEGILIIANSNDTANFCQQIKKYNRQLPLFTTSWAISGSILEYGGTAVEGLVFPEIFDRDHPGETYQCFLKAYIERFGDEPSFAALMGYETMQVIFQAMLNLEEISSDGLKEAIINQRNFKGLQEDFQIDKYGDAYRYFKLFTISDGKIKRIDM